MSKGKPGQDKGLRVDLSGFKSVEDAIAQANAVEKGFRVLAKKVILADEGNLSLLAMFMLSAIARVTGLHQATVHAIEMANPHAALPLVRAYSDVVVTALYIRDHPQYVEALVSHQPGTKSKRRSMAKLIAAVLPHAPGLKRVYDELSEGTHFGSTAMWASWTVEEGPEATFTYATYPRWRRPETDPLIIAAWLIELGKAFTDTLNSIGKRHLS